MNIFFFKIVIFGDYIFVVSIVFNKFVFRVFVLEFVFRIFFLGIFKIRKFFCFDSLWDIGKNKVFWIWIDLG